MAETQEEKKFHEHIAKYGSQATVYNDFKKFMSDYLDLGFLETENAPLEGLQFWSKFEIK